jgi:hypothetical protein
MRRLPASSTSSSTRPSATLSHESGELDVQSKPHIRSGTLTERRRNAIRFAPLQANAGRTRPRCVVALHVPESVTISSPRH